MAVPVRIYPATGGKETYRAGSHLLLLALELYRRGFKVWSGELPGAIKIPQARRSSAE